MMITRDSSGNTCLCFGLTDNRCFLVGFVVVDLCIRGSAIGRELRGHGKGCTDLLAEFPILDQGQIPRDLL